MVHKNINDVIVMWEQDNKLERTKGTHKTNFSIRKGVSFNVGDLYFKGKDKQDNSLYWRVEKILNERTSTLKGRDYIETECSFIRQG